MFSTATRSGSSPMARPSRAQKVATFEVAMKAEGLAVLGTEKDGPRTAVKLLITYDNDPHATISRVESSRRRSFAKR